MDGHTDGGGVELGSGWQRAALLPVDIPAATDFALGGAV